MSDAPVVHRNEAKSRFEIELGDGELAFAEYRLRDDRVIFPHTIVPPEFQNRGMASALAKTALDWTRAQGLKAVPACAFFEAYVKRHPEYQDLLPAAG